MKGNGFLYLLFIAPLMILLSACGLNNSQIDVGSNAPAFTLPDAAGGEVSLSDYSGQPVLLYFHMAVG